MPGTRRIVTDTCTGHSHHAAITLIVATLALLTSVPALAAASDRTMLFRSPDGGVLCGHFVGSPGFLCAGRSSKWWASIPNYGRVFAIRKYGSKVLDFPFSSYAPMRPRDTRADHGVRCKALNHGIKCRNLSGHGATFYRTAKPTIF